MPPSKTTRQQQVHEHIILSQMPAWLADPTLSTTSTGVTRKGQPPSSSLLRRIITLSPSPTTGGAVDDTGSSSHLKGRSGGPPMRQESPHPDGGVPAAVTDPATYEAFRKPFGRVAAGSPLPATSERPPAVLLPPSAATPPPVLSKPRAMVGSLAVSTDHAVVQGAHPAWQGLCAVLDMTRPAAAPPQPKLLLRASLTTPLDASFAFRAPSSSSHRALSRGVGGFASSHSSSRPGSIRTVPERRTSPLPPPPPLPRRAPFVVQDMSGMDPFSLMERGVVEELARFRAGPQSYFETFVLPNVAVELPAPPEASLQCDTGGVHPQLLPPCVMELWADAKDLRRRELQRLAEVRRTMPLHHGPRGDDSGKKKNTDADEDASSSYCFIGGPYVGAGGGGGGIFLHHLVGSEQQTSHQRVVTVSLTAAERYLEALSVAVQNFHDSSSMYLQDDTIAPTVSSKKTGGNTGASRAAVASALLAKQQQLQQQDVSLDRPSAAHRRAAVAALSKHLDDVSRIIAARREGVSLLRSFNLKHAVDHARSTTDQTRHTPPPPPAPNDDPRSNATQPVVPEAALPKVIYLKGLCMAARDLAELLSASAAHPPSSNSSMGLIVEDAASPQPPNLTRSARNLSTLEQLCSQYGKVTEAVVAYIVYGLWPQPQTVIATMLLQWLDSACASFPSSVPTTAATFIGPHTDPVLLQNARLDGGAAWQRHPVYGAVTVMILSSGYQELSFIKQHRNLPVVELRRCFNSGLMQKEERGYDLTYSPEHYEIRAVHPLVHPLVCGPNVEIVVELPHHVLVSCCIEAASSASVAPQPGRSLGTSFVDRFGKYAKLHAILLEPVPARLVVFARHPSELHYRRASTVLLKPAALSLWSQHHLLTDKTTAEVADAPTPPPEATDDTSAPSGGGGGSGVVLTSLSTVDSALRQGRGNRGVTKQPGAALVFPEEFEIFQARLGLLLAPREGELTDAATATADGARDPSTVIALHLPPGVVMGMSARAALASGGVVFSFRVVAECQRASVTGAHGTTELYRVPCWGTAGAKVEMRPLAASGGGDAAQPLAWFFGVIKVKHGPPVTLWIDGQCALQWTVA